jgi:formate dehydrogenase assembly factor FdhD
MLIAVVWKAMISVQIEYQRREKVKIDLRPKRSDRRIQSSRRATAERRDCGYSGTWGDDRVSLRRLPMRYS